MNIEIAEAEMRGSATAHTARRADPANAPNGRSWIVSWLPGRALTRNQAITAMVMARASECPAAEAEPEASL
jgi:hypothetical protein